MIAILIISFKKKLQPASSAEQDRINLSKMNDNRNQEERIVRHRVGHDTGEIPNDLDFDDHPLVTNDEDYEPFQIEETKERAELEVSQKQNVPDHARGAAQIRFDGAANIPKADNSPK